MKIGSTPVLINVIHCISRNRSPDCIKWVKSRSSCKFSERGRHLAVGLTSDRLTSRNMSSEIMFRHVSVGGQVGGYSDSESQFLVFRL